MKEILDIYSRQLQEQLKRNLPTAQTEEKTTASHPNMETFLKSLLKENHTETIYIVYDGTSFQDTVNYCLKITKENISFFKKEAHKDTKSSVLAYKEFGEHFKKPNALFHTVFKTVLHDLQTQKAVIVQEAQHP